MMFDTRRCSTRCFVAHRVYGSSRRRGAAPGRAAGCWHDRKEEELTVTLAKAVPTMR